MNEPGFFKQNFDKIFLGFLFLVGLIAFLHFSRSLEFYGTSKNSESLSDIVHWLEGIVGQILAALLTMMVGSRMTATAQVGPTGKVEVTAGDSVASSEKKEEKTK